MPVEIMRTGLGEITIKCDCGQKGKAPTISNALQDLLAHLMVCDSYNDQAMLEEKQ